MVFICVLKIFMISKVIKIKRSQVVKFNTQRLNKGIKKGKKIKMKKPNVDH